MKHSLVFRFPASRLSILFSTLAVPAILLTTLVTGAQAKLMPEEEAVEQAIEEEAAIRRLSQTAEAVDTAQERRFFNAAKAYADVMMTHGRDIYGPESSPLFASMLTRGTYRLLDNPDKTLPDMKEHGVRRHDRAWNGSNPMHDEELYKLLYQLTEITGDQQYAQAADDALVYFFETTQHPITGLFAWGEHISWRLDTDAPHADKEMLHEMLPWTLWPKAYRLAPRQAYRFALGLWHHQMMNKATGDFSRHARYDMHLPRPDGSFPRYGSNMIAVWTHAYNASKHPMFKQDMLTAIETVVDSFLARIDPNTSALPAGTGRYGNVYWLVNNLLMTCELAELMGMLPQELEAKIAELNQRTDEVIFKLKHNLDGHLADQPLGYQHRAYTDTLMPGDPRKKFSNDYTTLWARGYGAPLTSTVAALMLDRYEQTGQDRYRDLAMQGIDLYLEHDPDTSKTLHPGTLAEAIKTLLKAHRLTGDDIYLQRAQVLGDQSIALFIAEDCPLPRVTMMHDHYETITGGDDLMLALLELDQALIQ